MRAVFRPIASIPPLLIGGPNSQRLGFAEPKPPNEVGTIPGKRSLGPGAEVAVLVPIRPTHMGRGTEGL